MAYGKFPHLQVFFGHIVFHNGGERQRITSDASDGILHRTRLSRAWELNIHDAVGSAGNCTVLHATNDVIDIILHFKGLSDNAVARLFRGLQHIISGRQVGEHMCELRIRRGESLQRCVGGTLSRHRIFDVLHSTHFRHFCFHTARTRTARANRCGNQVESAHRHVARQLEMVSFPIYRRGRRCALRLCLSFHHIVSLCQVHESDSIVRSCGMQRSNLRGGVILLVKPKRRF